MLLDLPRQFASQTNQDELLQTVMIRVVEVIPSARRGALLLCAVQPTVKKILDRSKLTQEIGAENFYWSADQAILAASERGM